MQKESARRTCAVERHLTFQRLSDYFPPARRRRNSSMALLLPPGISPSASAASRLPLQLGSTALEVACSRCSARAVDSCLDVLRNLMEPGSGRRLRKRRVGGSLAMTGSANALREARKRGECVSVGERNVVAKHLLQARARMPARALFEKAGEAVGVMGIWKYCKRVAESIKRWRESQGRPFQANSKYAPRLRIASRRCHRKDDNGAACARNQTAVDSSRTVSLIDPESTQARDKHPSSGSGGYPRRRHW